MRKHDEIIEIELEILLTTEKALLVSNIKNEEVWLPKSQISLIDVDELDDLEPGDVIDVEIPERLAKTKDLM